MRTHILKILPEYYDPLFFGEKRFEIRKDDRDFHVGDKCVFKEWQNGSYSDAPEIAFRIKYILRDCQEYGLMDGYCILGF